MDTKVIVWMIFLVSMGAQAAHVSIDTDGMLVVDGERAFIVGLYENPSDTAILETISNSGFNLVQSQPDTAALDRLHAQGLWGWVNTGVLIDLSADRGSRETSLRDHVARLASHPAFLVHEAPDEALWNVWYGAMLWRGGEEPRQLLKMIESASVTTEKAALTATLNEARALWQRGHYSEAETQLDQIWKALGQPSPQPGLSFSNAPERAALMQQGFIEGRALLKAIDPSHPLWLNHAPRNQITQLAKFNEAADIAGCDIYPVPESPEVGHSDLRDKTLACVGAYTDRMQAAAPGKPVWMVLQGFGWGDIQPERTPEARKALRRPTLNETRFMAFDSIVHGARGLLYWGTAYVEKDSAFWTELLTVTKDLGELAPVLAARDADLALTISCRETFGSVDRGIRVLAKAIDGKIWLIAANEFSDPLSYRIDGLHGLDGSRYVERYSGEQITVADNALASTLPGYHAAVFEPR